VKQFLSGLLLVLLLGCASDGNRSQSAEQKLAIAKIHTELAASYFQRSQFAISLQEIDVALQAKVDYAPAYNVRGLVRMALREDARAEADFRYSLELDTRNSEAHNNYGWFICQRGREREAIGHFTEALNNPLYETPEIPNVNAGICAQRLGEINVADEYFQRALMLKPNQAEALIALAELNFSKADYLAARTYFLRYIQQSSELTPAQLYLAVKIERKLGNRDAEQSFTLQLRKRFPDSREAQQLTSGE
jgi:type IV pilus assembly protein PilF